MYQQCSYIPVPSFTDSQIRKAHTLQCKPCPRLSTLNMHQGKACYLAALSKSEENESTTQPFNLDTKEYTMPKSTFIPAGDHDFLVWTDFHRQSNTCYGRYGV